MHTTGSRHAPGLAIPASRAKVSRGQLQGRVQGRKFALFQFRYNTEVSDFATLQSIRQVKEEFKYVLISSMGIWRL